MSPLVWDILNKVVRYILELEDIILAKSCQQDLFIYFFLNESKNYSHKPLIYLLYKFQQVFQCHNSPIWVISDGRVFKETMIVNNKCIGTHNFVQMFERFFTSVCNITIVLQNWRIS